MILIKKFLAIEKKLMKNNIDVISIDDLFYRHHSRLVFTNKEKEETKFIIKNQKWFSGFKYALTESSAKFMHNKKSDVSKDFKILFYSGGNEDYFSFNNFF